MELVVGAVTGEAASSKHIDKRRQPNRYIRREKKFS